MDHENLSAVEEMVIELLYTGISIITPMIDQEHDGSAEMALALCKGLKEQVDKHFKNIHTALEAQMNFIGRIQGQRVQTMLKFGKATLVKLDRQLRYIAALMKNNSDFTVFHTGCSDYDVIPEIAEEPYFAFEKIGQQSTIKPKILSAIKKGHPISYPDNFGHWVAPNIAPWDPTDIEIDGEHSDAVFVEAQGIGEGIQNLQSQLKEIQQLAVRQRDIIQSYAGDYSSLKEKYEKIISELQNQIVGKEEATVEALQKIQQFQEREASLAKRELEMKKSLDALNEQIANYKESPEFLLQKNQQHDLKTLLEKAAQLADVKLYADRLKKKVKEIEAKLADSETEVKKKQLKISDLESSVLVLQTFITEQKNQIKTEFPKDPKLVALIKQQKSTRGDQKRCERCTFDNQKRAETCELCFAKL